MTPDDVERLLADFRGWLLAAPEPPPEPADAGPPVDLATLVGQFTALRHEVNLQTRASRAQLELNAQTLDQLAQALDAVRRPPVPPALDGRADDDALRAQLKAVLDVYDALALARREVQRLHAQLPAEPTATTDLPAPPDVSVQLPFWARWLRLGAAVETAVAPLHDWTHRATARLAAADTASRLRQMVDAILVGYDMSLQRLERTLRQCGLETIPAVGQPFDPETMEVAEVVRDASRTGTEVIEEVRPGYRWRGKLFRYAQVRVTRP
jgi:molecular chaperone GrpE